MHGIQIKLAALYFLLGSILPVWAQENPRQLSLNAIWQLVLQNNPAYRQADLALRQRQAEVRMRRSDLLPTLSSASFYNYVSELPRLELPFSIPGFDIMDIDVGIRGRTEFGLSLTQPLFTGFRTRNILRSARNQLKATEAHKIASRNELILRAGQLYYSLQLHRLQASVFDAAVRRAGLQLQITRNLYLADQATEFDTLEVANRILQVQQRREENDRHFEIQISRLKQLMSVDFDFTVAPYPGDSLVVLESLAAYQDMAAQSRPEIRRLDFLRRAMEFQARAARSTYLPQIHANLGYFYGRPGVNFFSDQWMGYYTAGVSAQWLLWDWGGNKRVVEKARLEVDKTLLAEKQQADEIAQQIEEAYLFAGLSRRQITLQRRIVAQESRRFEITQEKYQQDLATALEVSIAETSLLEAELQLQRYRIEWQQRFLALEFAAGIIGRRISESGS